MDIQVYASIAAIQGELARTGIEKNRRNSQGTGYNFRGIDDIYNHLAPLLAVNKLVIVPRVISHKCTERTSKNGGALFYTVLEVEFDFVSAVDGSKHTARTIGEAMDSGDKSSNKAMSAAYKYAAFQVFCIPTEADNDADAHTHQVEPQRAGMSETVLADYLATIDSASTLDALKKAYTTAKTAAEAAADRDAYKSLTTATTARKAALEADAKPAYAEQA